MITENDQKNNLTFDALSQEIHSLRKRRSFTSTQQGIQEDFLSAVKEKFVNDNTPTHLIRFICSLISLPPSGGGGCHQALLGSSNYGAAANLSIEEISLGLNGFVHGQRRVSEREIKNAATKAVNEHMCSASSDFDVIPQFKPKLELSETGLERFADIVRRGKPTSFTDIQCKSPVKIPNKPHKQQIVLLEALYDPDDVIYLTPNEKWPRSRQKQCARRQGSWIKNISKLGKHCQFAICNPISGNLHSTKDGNLSYRCDDAIVKFLFALAEIDPPPDKPALAEFFSLENQLKFWQGFDLYPIVALIYSGGKSIHAWLKVENVKTAEEWQEVVYDQMFAELVPMGVDKACRNPARFSRFPGHKRKSTGRCQQLLWLNPEGGLVEND